jgi:Spy/CpxP family protein refolding chaperone
MRNLWRASLTLALVAFVASPAMAQRQPPRGGFGGFALYTNKSVQEELKVTDDQKKKLEDVSKKVADFRREKTKDLTQEDRRNREKMAPINAEIAKETDKLLGEVFTSEQNKRYKQITLQQQGTRAFSNPDVQKALKFTDEQKESVKKIGEETRKAIEEQTKDLDFMDFQKRREIMTKLNKEAEGKIAATLTAEQKKSWKEMIGDKFEIKFERPGGGRPGGGRPGGGGRPRNDL